MSQGVHLIRYSAIRLLYHDLAHLRGLVPPFPPKQLSTGLKVGFFLPPSKLYEESFDEKQVLEQRRLGLESYLQAVAAHDPPPNQVYLGI